jgi:hypothetical protein
MTSTASTACGTATTAVAAATAARSTTTTAAAAAAAAAVIAWHLNGFVRQRKKPAAKCR